jgi:glycosyltransferase involved in cell wall biosynthesis
MYNKTVVVASKINVFKEIIKDGQDGLLFKTQNSDDLALKIINTTKKKFKRAIVNNAFIKIRKKFCLEKTANETNNIYKKILTSNDIK